MHTFTHYCFRCGVFSVLNAQTYLCQTCTAAWLSRYHESHAPTRRDYVLTT